MRPVTIGAVVFVLFLSTSCSPQTSSPSVTTTSEGQVTEGPAGKDAAKEGTALVRFINADPGAKMLQVLAADKPLFQDIAYKTVTPYTELPRGYTQFKLHIPGAADEIAASRRELFPGRHYTLVALPPKKGKAILVTLSDNLGALDPGEARIRLINATTDVDDLDLFKEGTNNRIAHGVDAGAVTSFTDSTPGSVEVHKANQPTPMKLSMLPVESDRLYTFIVVGSANSLDAVQVVDRIEP
jgi:hypothetical protein